jgi:hypothetical protein
MPIGDALTFSYPTTGDTYASALAKIKVVLETFEALLEQDIDTGSLDLTGALSLGGSYLYNLIRVVLAQVATAPTDLGSLYVDDDGELHIVTPAGDIKITLNGQVNVVTTGAIVGDYGAADEAVYYDQVSGEYRFFTDTSPEAWAFLVAKAFRAVKDAGAAGTAQFGVDASVSTDLVFNLKTLPSGAGEVGGLAYDVDDSAVVDASVTRETLEHLFTDIDCAGDANVEGELRHGDWTKTGSMYWSDGGIVTVSGTPANGNGWNGGTNEAHAYIAMGTDGVAFLRIPTEFKSNEKVRSVKLYYADNANANTEMSVYFGQAPGSAGILTQKTGSGGTRASALNSQTVTLDTPAVPTYGLWVALDTNGASTGPKVVAYEIVYYTD